MKIFIILAICTQGATCLMTNRQKQQQLQQQFNKLQCEKLKQSMESKMDAPINLIPEWNQQFKTMCGNFYQKPIGNLDPRPIISYESFARWLKRNKININEINKKIMYITESCLSCSK